MSFRESLENHPVPWAISAIVAIAIATIAVEERYAKAADMKQIQKSLEDNREAMERKTQTIVLKNRKLNLEDKVIDLTIKEEETKLNSAEKRQLLRYKSELEDTDRELRRLDR